MDIQGLHQLIDEWAAKQSAQGEPPPPPAETKRELPKDKQAVRTKSTGDKVYILDDKLKTRQWVQSSTPGVDGPTLLKELGWEMDDVVEIDDTEFIRYNPGPLISKADA